MGQQVQLRRGTSAETAAFTGAVGEVTVDTTDDRVVVHDGSTAGGIPMAKESELVPYTAASSSGAASIQLFEDTDNGTNKVTIIPTASLTADRTLTLPNSSGTVYVTGGTDVSLADGGTGASLSDPNADRIMFWDDSAGAVTWLVPGTNLEISTTNIRPLETFIIAASDETTAITTGTNKATFVIPYDFTVTSVGASLNTVSSSGTPTIDINESGTTILSTKITIDASEKTSLTAATAPVISDSTLTAGNEIGIDIDTAGTGAKGLKVWLRGYAT